MITGVLEPTGIAIDGDYLYIAEYNASKISKLNLTTLVKTDYINNLSGPTGLVIHNNTLYFSDFDTNIISKVDITANVPVITQLSDGFTETAFLGLVGSELYVAEYGSGKLSKINTTNRTISDVATNLGGVYGLVNNSTQLFLSQRDTNKISRISLPNLSSTNFDLENKISFYPNPTSNYLTLKNVSIISKIIIYDLSGRIVKQLIYQKPTIDSQNLNKGIYFLSVNKNKTIKFIKN